MTLTDEDRALIESTLTGTLESRYVADSVMEFFESELAALLSAARNEKLGGEWVMVPREPTYELLRAMSESVAVDDEGPFPPLFELLDFSGENKTYTVLRAAYAAMLAAAPPASQIKEG